MLHKRPDRQTEALKKLYNHKNKFDFIINEKVERINI